MRRAGGNSYFYLNDHVGTPLMMTSGSGTTVVWEARYKPFGEATIHPMSGVSCQFRFPGQYADEETGFHYNYHRYYDPRTGRYLTPDPIGLAGGINLFNYAANNSINSIDSLGLSYLVFNRCEGTLDLFSEDGELINSFPAGNRVAGGASPWPEGTFPYLYYNRHPESGTNDPFGLWGIFVFNVPGRSGIRAAEYGG